MTLYLGSKIHIIVLLTFVKKKLLKLKCFCLNNHCILFFLSCFQGTHPSLPTFHTSKVRPEPLEDDTEEFLPS